jgi:hypothetical protein
MDLLEPFPAGARETARLGDWTIRATGIARRGRRHPRQVCLLFPPAGFAGKARLGVIAADRRDEFAYEWAPGDSTPLLFSIPVANPETDARVHADLLLEVAPANLTGRVAFARTRDLAHIYLAPVLGAGGPDASALLRELAREPAMRLALDASRLVASDAARALIGSGRLEIVDSGAAAAGGPALPFPPRTRVDTSPPDPLLRGLPAGVRALLLLGEEAARWAAGEHLPFRLVAPERTVLACVVPTPCAIDPRGSADGARAAAVLDRMLLTPPHRAPGFCALPLAGAAELRALNRFVRVWNRHHVTPRLQLATPADYFALVEELEARGVLFVPQRQLG